MFSGLGRVLFAVVLFLAVDWTIQWQLRLLKYISLGGSRFNAKYRSSPKWKYTIIAAAAAFGFAAFKRGANSPAWSLLFFAGLLAMFGLVVLVSTYLE